MKVLINAVSLVEGGGLVVLTKLVQYLCQNAPSIQWFLLAHPHCLETFTTIDNLHCLPFLSTSKTPVHFVYLYNVLIPKLIKQFKIDCLFSLTNFLPHRRLACPSLLLIHQVGYFQEPGACFDLQWGNNFYERFIWQFKRKWAIHSIRQASSITVQTQSLAKVIVNELAIKPAKITVVPHGTGLLNKGLEQPKASLSSRCIPWRIGYITKFGIQKDFVTALKAMAQLKKAGILFKFILTLDEQDSACIPIFQTAAAYGLTDDMENHGNLHDNEQLKVIYQSLDIFIFPSLCESFGFTLVEAMAHGLPILIADTPSNREVAGSAGRFFTPRDAGNLAAGLLHLMQSTTHYASSARDSIQRAQFFCWNKTAKALLKLIRQLTNPLSPQLERSSYA